MATSNIYNLTDTWNDGATTFTAFKMNVTNTASASGSKVIDLQVDGTSLFNMLGSGYLGIGTATPTNKIDIVNATNTRSINIYNNTATTALGQLVVDAASITTGGGLWVGTSCTTFSNTTTGLAYFAVLDASATGNVVMINNSGSGYGLRMLTGKNTPLIYLDATAITTSYGIQGAFGGLTTGAAIDLGTNNASFSGNGVIRANVGSSSATGSAIYATQSGSGAAGRFDSSKGYGIDIQSTSTTTAGMRVFMTNQNNNECLQLFSYNAPTGSGKALTVYNTASSTLNAWIAPSGGAYFADNVLLGTTTAPTTGTKCLTLGTGTAPTATAADTVTQYSSDLSAGNTIPSFYTEGTGVTDAGVTSTTVTTKVAVRVNGTVYYLLATTNGT